ncbi:MAG: transposase [Gordonibacter sp.]|nr:transposase [Gordonibacter sp.]
MTAMDAVLFNDSEVKRMALCALEECCDLQAFGRKMLEARLNSAMSAKADAACNVAYGKRDAAHTFPEDIIERCCRIDRALVACVTEMYVMGVSTRKVEAVAMELGISSMSKSEVARLCEVFASEVSDFRSQRFDGVRLVISDEHAGLARTIEEAFQGTTYQRCITHLMCNVSGRIHKKADL